MRTKLMVFVLLVIFAATASSSNIAPEIVEMLKASGQLDQIVEADRQAREKGVWEANPDPYRFGVATDIDTLHCLIILVDFDDMDHESGLHAESEDFDTLLFSQDVWEPGSMTDYYWETSYEQAQLMGQVTQWYRMPQQYAYYVDGQRGFGSYPRNAQKLTEDAVLAADPDVDFSLYDNSGNGQVDALFIVHAGPGYEDTGNVNYIHSHAWVTSYYMSLDGVYVYRYSMEPEETASGQLITIGVFCHEYGHVLGLPDLYDYDYDSNGVGMWSVMAGGSWGGGGATPVHFDAWCKYDLDWVNPTRVGDPLINEQIDAVEFSPDIYQLFSLDNYSNEFFMVENRRQVNFDVSIPQEGLLIYHVDESVPNNNDQTHYKVAVEQADGEFDLENNRGADGGDPWPGQTENRTFDDFSAPNAWLYNNQPSEVAVANISDSDSTMFADLSVMYSTPLYVILDMTFDDDSGGNNNGRPEPGEIIEFLFTAQNSRAFAGDLVVFGSCSDPEIVFTDSISALGGHPVNEPFDNEDDPMIFTVPSDYSSNFVDIILMFTALGGEYQQEIRQRVTIGMPNILLVDDDGGLGESDYFIASAESLELIYDIWDVSVSGSPAGDLSRYPMVIWFTGDSRSEPMSASDVDGLISYLSSGGRLLMSSQDFVQRLSERGDSDDLILLNDFLKLDYDTYESNHMVYGESGTVFDELRVITAGVGGAGNQSSQDALTVLDGGQSMLTYGSDRIAAVGVADDYAAITIGFGLEGIYNDYPNWNSREDILDAGMAFLWEVQTSVPDTRPELPQTVALEQNYPNPFNPETNISFELPRAGNVQLVVYDLLGRMIDVSIDGFMEAGHYEINWDGSDKSSGIYFYRITTSDGSLTRRMTLLK
ncbi:MAG: M6 family metalloprotease domain-containing protein [candidate division Zixibacteria bacterium]